MTLFTQSRSMNKEGWLPVGHDLAVLPYWSWLVLYLHCSPMRNRIQTLLVIPLIFVSYSSVLVNTFKSFDIHLLFFDFDLTCMYSE